MSPRRRRRWKIPLEGVTTTALLEPTTTPSSRGLLVFGHGAGGRMEHPMMTLLAQRLRAAGLDVLRFDFPYRARGAGPPDRMPKLLDCFRTVAERGRAKCRPARLLVGGHSMGGRAASMLAAEDFDAAGLLLGSYPLHPPGKPTELRAAHLPRIEMPVLCLNGTRDRLCERRRMAAVLRRGPARWTMHWLEDADHGYDVRKRSGRTTAEVMAEIEAAARAWLEANFP